MLFHLILMNSINFTTFAVIPNRQNLQQNVAKILPTWENDRIKLKLLNFAACDSQFRPKNAVFGYLICQIQ